MTQHCTYDEVESEVLMWDNGTALNDGSTYIQSAIVQADLFIDNRLIEYGLTSTGSADALINKASCYIAAAYYNRNIKINRNKAREGEVPRYKWWFDQGSTFLHQFIMTEAKGIKDHLNDFGPPRAIWSNTSDAPSDYTQNRWS